MNPLTIHLANGNAFFLGLIFFITMSALGIFTAHPLYALISRNVLILGALFVSLSSTPIPLWFAAFWAISLLWVLKHLYARQPGNHRRTRFVHASVILLSLAAAGLELPYHLTPGILFDRNKTLVLIGDSISAGVENDGVHAAWPIIFRQQYGVRLIDLSYPGLTLQSALERLRQQDLSPYERPVFLLEIGGNDVLGDATAQQFSDDLHALLSFVSQTADTVIMLELPLPPFHHAYSKAQRRLAEAFRVTLIPKRFFAGVLGGRNATFDGLHLSQQGHQQMADMLGNLFFHPNHHLY
ncbi:hypothetical protein U27_00708 [Candidatus Vecturithrix granuli]|uniref:SGNH hydrolase-type esterase domain-containing protein n=1 Tax=Vecturithrix granuli TaxID=1499967 RepID=A0A081C8A5_VECG1|nr:hypothetical protein U27_00708 [Candidatus Vecturithrix granuli]